MGTPAPQRPVERVALVVDDEELVCRYTARVLMDAGLRVLEAHDGEEAMALLENLGPTVIGLVVSDTATLAQAIGRGQVPALEKWLITVAPHAMASAKPPCPTPHGEGERACNLLCACRLTST